MSVEGRRAFSLTLVLLVSRVSSLRPKRIGRRPGTVDIDVIKILLFS